MTCELQLLRLLAKINVSIVSSHTHSTFDPNWTKGDELKTSNTKTGVPNKAAAEGKTNGSGKAQKGKPNHKPPK